VRSTLRMPFLACNGLAKNSPFTSVRRNGIHPADQESAF
jgi:hypothetical protein